MRELVRREASAATPEEVLARARPFVWELVADSNDTCAWTPNIGFLETLFGVHAQVSFRFFRFSDFSLYGSWEARNVCKSYVGGLGTFLDVGKSILRTLIFDIIFQDFLIIP